MAELVEDYEDKVNEILNETCFDALIKKCVTLNYNPDNIISAKWYVEGDKEITGVGLLIHYKTKEKSLSYRYGKLTFINNVSIEDFINKKNLEIQEARNIYGFGYDVDIQNTRDDLVNAIFEANGMSKECPEDALRLFKDDGYDVDAGGLGESNGFEVVQIENGKITSFYIRIKYSSSDEQYIQKLKDKKAYRVAETIVISLDGKDVSFKRKQNEIQSVEPLKEVLNKRKKENEDIARNITIYEYNGKKQNDLVYPLFNIFLLFTAGVLLMLLI